MFCRETLRKRCAMGTKMCISCIERDVHILRRTKNLPEVDVIEAQEHCPTQERLGSIIQLPSEKRLGGEGEGGERESERVSE